MTPLTHPSPNFGDRRGGVRPHLIVLHYTAMPGAAEALDRLCDPTAEVSAHYLIAQDGALATLVTEEKRAWHAGAGAWGRCTDVNSASIGIELDNDGASPFTAALMDRLERLLGDIMARWAIPPEGVIAHQDMAPLRKSDPGPRFDWRRLALGSRAVWPGTTSDHDTATGGFRSNAARFGYTSDNDAAVLRAFRTRFRPGATGPVSDKDRALIADLARRFPVDRAAPTP